MTMVISFVAPYNIIKRSNYKQTINNIMGIKYTIQQRLSQFTT